MTAIRTCPGPVAWIPAEVQTAAYRAVKGVAFAVFPESTLTGFFVRISLVEISQIHSNSFLLDNNTAAKSAPSTMMTVQTLLNLDDCGYSFYKKELHCCNSLIMNDEGNFSLRKLQERYQGKKDDDSTIYSIWKYFILSKRD